MAFIRILDYYTNQYYYFHHLHFNFQVILAFIVNLKNLLNATRNSLNSNIV